MKRNLLPSLLALLALGACSDAFDPIDPSGPPFSVFGVLDAGADTQWIRVNGLRSTLVASTAPTGFQATLENLGSGHVITLRDSATAFANMLGGEPSFAHNFWTAERLEPGASYRFRVQADSARAEAVVEVPREYDLEVWISQQLTTGLPGPDAIWLAGVRHVPFLVEYTSHWDLCDPALTARASFIVDALCRSGLCPREAPGGDTLARMVTFEKDTVERQPDLARPTCGDFRYTGRELEVVVSAAPWPLGQDYTTWKLIPGDLATNVSNSLGFLGGLLIRRVPYERCAFTQATATDRYCKLRYDSTTATLSGRMAGACPIPPDSLHIALREIDPSPSGPPRNRQPYHDRAGNYEIGALRPGIRHELTVTAGLAPAVVVYADTLAFAAGEHASHFATLRWEGSCPWR